MLARSRGLRAGDYRMRRGVTLVEMLVTVAVLVIIMTILVQIFQAATGALSAAQAYQQLDDQLRRLDSVIRSDLEGVTARFTPPLDPANNLGYFEYGENEFADLQGEDSDDYIRFTAKAPDGSPFTGRFWAVYYPNGSPTTTANQPEPITITSEYAEIIYFLRNGNLYRRVLLVAPQMQPAISNTILQVTNNKNAAGNYQFYPTFLQPSTTATLPVSWQGVNDLSARPAATGSLATAVTPTTVILNSLGDLTNRENRFAYPRFANDFWNASAGGPGQDGNPDDINGDNVPDLYPSLYPNVFNPNLGLINTNWPSGNASVEAGALLMAFPYIFPGAYSQPQNLTNYQAGWIHSPTPSVVSGGNTVTFSSNPLTYLEGINHNPVDLGDNMPTPTQTSQYQTWWGFPTWRETLSTGWNDPTVPLYYGGGSAPNGLSYGTWDTKNLAYNYLNTSNGYLNTTSSNLLPPMVSSWTSGGNSVTMLGFRMPDQLFCDGVGANSAFLNTNLWPLSWEDDLIMTNVRSFDVKAYDNALANYADLGWGDDYRLLQNNTDTNYANASNAQAPYMAGSYDEISQTYTAIPAYKYGNNQFFDLLNQTFAHEGRMPPLTTDNRLDAQYGLATNYLPFTSGYLVANKGTYNDGNVGDNTVGVVRMRRIWDSWSTEYSRAPGTGVSTALGFPMGPPFSPPVYPSYPAPYPAPLRGLQIQIRVADPTNRRIKQLTIRQDFTDRL